jgi:hypothetical protein
VGLIAIVTLLILPLTTAEAAQLTLTWNDMSGNEDGFHIERKPGNGGMYALLANVGAGTTGYVDGTVTGGSAYCYRVSAYNTAGDSPFSNEACGVATTPLTYAVTVTKSGAGSGTVASSPAGITCGTDCSENYASGKSIALSATPASGSTFTGWSGACAGTGSCTLIVDRTKSVTATFTAQATGTGYTLIVTKAGTGTGTITSSPNGVTCGNDCSQMYASGTSVTLIAIPAPGSVFAGWSGACSATGTCTTTMSGDRNVTATFATTGSIASGVSGDFNGDGKPDLLWRHETTGDVGVWFMNGTTSIGGASMTRVADTAWKLVGTGDFNGDGKPDLLWRREKTGDVGVWFMNGTKSFGGASMTRVADTAWKLVGPK